MKRWNRSDVKIYCIKMTFLQSDRSQKWQKTKQTELSNPEFFLRSCCRRGRNISPGWSRRDRGSDRWTRLWTQRCWRTRCLGCQCSTSGSRQKQAVRSKNADIFKQRDFKVNDSPRRLGIKIVFQKFAKFFSGVCQVLFMISVTTIGQCVLANDQRLWFFIAKES